jgi:hypothetical protein
MRPNRTVRRPTRWTPEEWRRVEDAARARNVPPARFVREAVLGAVQDGAPADAPVRRRARDELVHQLGRVLNNLRQLERAAAECDAPQLVQLAGYVAAATEKAIRGAPVRADQAAPLAAELIQAGRALNELVQRAHAGEQLPPDEELVSAVRRVYHVVQWCRG